MLQEGFQSLCKGRLSTVVLLIKPALQAVPGFDLGHISVLVAAVWQMIHARVDKAMRQKEVAMLVLELQAGDAQESSWLGLPLSSWAEGWMQWDVPEDGILRVLWRYRKALRERRHPSASLTPSKDADGEYGLPWVLCHLVWDEKGCSQLRYPSGKIVRQILNPVRARPRESPKGRGAIEWKEERRDSPTSYLGREVTKADKHLGQHWEQWDASQRLSARTGFMLGLSYRSPDTKIAVTCTVGTPSLNWLSWSPHPSPDTGMISTGCYYIACLLQNGPLNGFAAVILWEEGSPSIRLVAVFG